ncbi:MAG TPA: mechanosensitive ion channel family protein [Candidatus Polarisedimenticolia bacterium]|nr:mechanosensitive ion channel family protein [Candidatus Polarisedimenticolia bacterium]
MKLFSEFTDLSALYPALQHAVRIVVILIAAYISTRIIAKWVPRLRKRLVEQMTRRAGPDVELEKRAATLGGIFRKTINVCVWLLALVMVLREAGFDIGPLLAGAGVVGIAVGFGAQNLVRDVASGIFLLLENRVQINDVAIINGTGGLVEAINLRTITLRGLDGTLHVFTNGSINTLSNMTHSYSYYVFDIGVAYKEDTDRVVKVLASIADEMMREDEYKSCILEPLEVLGVDKFADSAVIIKVRIKTAPIKQWLVGREMNRRIKKKFDELGIEIPFPHVSLYFGEASKPVSLSLKELDREQLKVLIREVLEESKKQP